MTIGLPNPRRKQTRLRLSHLVIAGLAALVGTGDRVSAKSGGHERSVASIETRAAGQPVLAIVSLQRQRITVYDANGWILRAPVSSGQRGRETPAGVFSIIQKEAEHYSNLYDDAYMPDMQRLTWSGIALHGGSLPGYPASHGCIRMPYNFAERLFGATRLGLRVIVAPSDVAPIEITHPALFRPKPGSSELAAARTAEADEAAKKVDQARLAAGTAFRESLKPMVTVRQADFQKRRAEAEFATAEAAVGSADTPEAKQAAEDAKTTAAAKVAELEAQWVAAKAELQQKQDALTAARDAVGAAETARSTAADAARQAARALEPVSVLISRKTQRLYVRQAFEPILESPVTIQDPDHPIGTHVFTAMGQAGDNLRWSVVSLEGAHVHGGTVEARAGAPGRSGRDVEQAQAEPDDGAKAALDRITIPQDVLDRIPGIMPRSSLIITDEAPSSETGKGTDFVVLLSGEPQGGIKFRRRAPAAERAKAAEFGYVRPRERTPYWGSPYPAPFSTW